MLAEVIDKCTNALRFSGQIIAWTDSTIVLNWLSSCPSKWKTFVANRVAKIQEIVPYSAWKHVPSGDNPADLASRGVSVQDALNSQLWWHGPSWLISGPYPTSAKTIHIEDEIMEIKRVPAVVAHIAVPDSTILERYSSISKLYRVVSYIFRFKHNSLNNKSQKSLGELSSREITEAKLIIYKISQTLSFSEELTQLKASGKVKRSSILASLDPYLDCQGILRVGGRLHYSALKEEAKHPIILSHKSPLVPLLIDSVHKETLHGSFQLVFSQIRMEFWITRCRDTVRFQLRKCVVCRRQRAQTIAQLMGSLPSPRVNRDFPFNKVGVDYAGPFQLLQKKGRGSKTFKGYFAIFICLVTRAIHLEAVTDMTSENFLAAFKRFIGRRGKPSQIFSDCGTNFIGANKEIQRALRSVEFQSSVCHTLADLGISWNFNPPSAPHHGGLWEAGVKSVKHHLRRVIGASHLTYEEFQTLLCSIEGILNSRPLCPLSSDLSSLDFLTPGHFLIGRNLLALPEPDFSNVKQNRLSRFQFITQCTQSLWKRWSNEYLILLQQRGKWQQRERNVSIGDLMVIHEENIPVSHWRLGRVVQVHPGADGLVRVVTLKTASGSVKRPITKLSPILLSDEIQKPECNSPNV